MCTTRPGILGELHWEHEAEGKVKSHRPAQYVHDDHKQHMHWRHWEKGDIRNKRTVTETEQTVLRWTARKNCGRLRSGVP